MRRSPPLMNVLTCGETKKVIHTRRSELRRSQMSLSGGFRALVDFKDAEDVRRGGGIAHSVESEGRAGDGLQLRAFVQSQEAGHLAGLQEVERVGSGGRGGAVALHALQSLRPLPAGHHVQLHILRLLLVEQHLRRWRDGFRRTCFSSAIQMKTKQAASGFPQLCYRSSVFHSVFGSIFSRPLSA